MRRGVLALTALSVGLVAALAGASDESQATTSQPVAQSWSSTRA